MPLRRQIKNSIGRYSSAERLVREATSNDPSLPGHGLLLQISDMTKLQSLYADTIGMIFKRLNDKSKNWRRIYKALIVIEACLQNGSEQFVKDCRSQIAQIMTLCDFVYPYDQDPDAGRSIRQKAQRVVTLLKDNNLLDQERLATRTNGTKRESSYGRSRKCSGRTANCGRRSKSVYNPSDEYATPSNVEGRENDRMATTVRPNSSLINPPIVSSDNGKPTLLESSKKANNTQSVDLLYFDDPPSKSGRLNNWLSARSKRPSSVSTSELLTPSSSLIDSGPNPNGNCSTNLAQISALNAANGIKSSVLYDLSGLNFDLQSISSEREPNSIYDLGSSLSTKCNSIVPSTTVSTHRTSADAYFESQDKEKRTSTTLYISPTCKELAAKVSPLVPTDGNTNNESVAVADNTGSNYLAELALHRNLVELDNIIPPTKPPISNPPVTFNDSHLVQNQNCPKPSLLELGARTEPIFDWGVLAHSAVANHQPAVPLSNQLFPPNFQQPMMFNQTRQHLGDQLEYGALFTPALSTNRIPPVNTNPFL